ncbi:MAG: hypothetical protein A3G20_01165 [Acidobacteria bacterium RIFCSPLOWO2_12_FULL_59_11]|nr:MAG: hypothetical protein A3G20_01165 [Acidobacteria bacterium RIFCSPLOWO2_12_FULL_59_11]
MGTENAARIPRKKPSEVGVRLRFKANNAPPSFWYDEQDFCQIGNAQTSSEVKEIGAPAPVSGRRGGSCAE